MVGRRGLEVYARVGARLGGGLRGRGFVDVWGVDHVDDDSRVGVVRAPPCVKELHELWEAVGAVQTASFVHAWGCPFIKRRLGVQIWQ